ncbi:unnamed protein product [Effrenium voratum]|nr:unnamed protein product [Effrenium voratum]
MCKRLSEVDQRLADLEMERNALLVERRALVGRHVEASTSQTLKQQIQLQRYREDGLGAGGGEVLEGSDELRRPWSLRMGLLGALAVGARISVWTKRYSSAPAVIQGTRPCKRCSLSLWFQAVCGLGPRTRHVCRDLPRHQLGAK